MNLVNKSGETVLEIPGTVVDAKYESKPFFEGGKCIYVVHTITLTSLPEEEPAPDAVVGGSDNSTFIPDCGDVLERLKQGPIYRQACWDAPEGEPSPLIQKDLQEAMKAIEKATRAPALRIELKHTGAVGRFRDDSIVLGQPVPDGEYPWWRNGTESNPLLQEAINSVLIQAEKICPDLTDEDVVWVLTERQAREVACSREFRTTLACAKDAITEGLGYRVEDVTDPRNPNREYGLTPKVYGVRIRVEE